MGMKTYLLLLMIVAGSVTGAPLDSTLQLSVASLDENAEPVPSVNPAPSLQLSIPGLEKYEAGRVPGVNPDNQTPSLQLSIPGLDDYENTINKIKEIAGSTPKPKVKEAEEHEGIFGQIIKANKENNMTVHEADMLVKSGRSATTCTQCLWPKSTNGTVNVPYTLSSVYGDLSLGTYERSVFQNAMDEFETLTCVRFVNRTTEKDFLDITSTSGCLSYVGKIGGGQTVGINARGCMIRGIIQHELNHALGFYHEHMRSDRDDYITINSRYISPGDLPNFNKAVTNNLGLEYDYSSVMHYDKFAFTNTSGQPTIVPKPNANVPIGQRDGLSVLDVSKINRLYQCNVCANLLNDNNGILSSANYPSPYAHNANCVWLIRTPSGQVSLNFKGFDVQSSPNCVSDYIRIYDGPTKRSPLVLDRSCGTGLIPPIIASTNQLLVEFSSDSSGAGLGFKATYTTVQCGGTFYSPQRAITSPGYPNSYRPNLECVFTITAPVGKRISLTVSDFELEDAMFCMYDSLEMFDGSIRYGPFCGTERVPVITSAGNTMQLTLSSDESTEKRGFKASYTFI